MATDSYSRSAKYTHVVRCQHCSWKQWGRETGWLRSELARHSRKVHPGEIVRGSVVPLK